MRGFSRSQSFLFVPLEFEKPAAYLPQTWLCSTCLCCGDRSSHLCVISPQRRALVQINNRLPSKYRGDPLSAAVAWRGAEERGAARSSQCDHAFALLGARLASPHPAPLSTSAPRIAMHEHGDLLWSHAPGSQAYDTVCAARHATLCSSIAPILRVRRALLVGWI